MNNLKWIILFTIAMVVGFIAYWGGLSEEVSRWSNQEEYSHGFLIPLVTLYILWEKRQLIQSSVTEPLWSGVLVVFIAIVMFAVGEVSALYIVIQYSYVLMLIGLSMVTVGGATRYTLAPILLLLFAIPLPYVIEVLLTAKLQLMSSWLGVSFIRLCNIPVFLEGNVIDLGIYKLTVVEACSGLRYLFPLMSLGFITAYFYQASFWKRAIVFISTVPITIFMNSFRIGAIGVLVDKWGISMAEGFLHDFEGWIIFMACAVILIVLIWILERLTTKQVSFSKIFGVVAEPQGYSLKYPSYNSRSTTPLISVIILLIVAGTMTHFIANRTELKPGHVSFVNFPVNIANWHGVHRNLDKEIVEKLEMTDYLLADYQNEKKEQVNFYVAYYESQRKGASPHSPRVCIPGGGWEITDFDRITKNGHPINRTIIKKGENQQLVYYWFQGHGRVVANEYINKWYLFLDSIFKNRTDGSLVRLVTAIGPHEDEKQADARLEAFMGKVEPELKNYILD